MLKNIILILVWFYGLAFLLAVTGFVARKLKGVFPEMSDEEVELWRCAFEGTEFEFRPVEKR